MLKVVFQNHISVVKLHFCKYLLSANVSTSLHTSVQFTLHYPDDIATYCVVNELYHLWCERTKKNPSQAQRTPYQTAKCICSLTDCSFPAGENSYAEAESFFAGLSDVTSASGVMKCVHFRKA